MSQLRALVGLRWRMVRSSRARRGLQSLLVLFLILLVQGAAVGQQLPPGKRLFDLLLLAPTIFLVFVGLVMVAPLIAGGGNELFPEGQLVAFPIKPRTIFAGSVATAPLNLAWMTQLLVLVATTAAVSQRGPRVVLAIITTLTFAAGATVVGQALAWFVVGVRQRARGRAVTRLVGLGLLLAALAALATGSTTTLLDHSPTGRVVIGAIAGSQGRYGLWLSTTAVLVLLAWFGARAGVRACAWAIRRTAPAGRPELAPVQRRPGRRGVRHELVAIDRASIWRSTPLRRGVLVLALLPGGVAMLAHPTWPSLTLLPGLVAAGAGLLFGVNAFCLDGGGAVWVASLPHDPRITFTSKLVVVFQTCLAAVALAECLAVTQVREAPSAAELVAVVGSMLGATLLVVATCGRISIQHPHKADLRGPRDTPAPPAAMAVYSLRLALGTTWAGLAFGAAAGTGSLGAAVAGCVAVFCFGTRSLVRTLEKWSSPALRARVVTTVSYG
jgi:hypothetical protein